MIPHATHCRMEGRFQRIAIGGIVLRHVQRLMLAAVSLGATSCVQAALVMCGEGEIPAQAGNLSCTTAAEQKIIHKLINGPWVIGECNVHYPNGWRTRRDPKSERIFIIPNPSSFLTEFNFRASVQTTSRPPNEQEREKSRLIDEWESEGEAKKYPNFDDWLEARKSPATIHAQKAQNAVKNQMSFRYVAGVLEGRGEDSEEFEAAAPITHDVKNLSWQVAFSIKDMGGMYAEPDTPVEVRRYTCSASDELSIDAFSSVCTAVWESMMLSDDSPGICMEK